MEVIVTAIHSWYICNLRNSRGIALHIRQQSACAQKRRSLVRASASLCGWLPCGCTTAAGAAIPIQVFRPWSGARFGMPRSASGRVGMWTAMPPSPGVAPDQRSSCGKAAEPPSRIASQERGGRAATAIGVAVLVGDTRQLDRWQGGVESGDLVVHVERLAVLPFEPLRPFESSFGPAKDSRISRPLGPGSPSIDRSNSSADRSCGPMDSRRGIGIPMVITLSLDSAYIVVTRSLTRYRVRTIPPHIRRALEERDRSCRFPGCRAASPRRIT